MKLWTESRRRACRAVLMAACVVALTVSASAGTAYCDDYAFMEPLGFADARLMGMGYSHVALWGEPNPLYSNPASFGLARERLILAFGSGWGADGGEDGAESNFRFVAVSDVDRGAGAGGFAWGQYRWSEGDELFSSNTFNYMVGKRFTDWGALGVGVRYLRGGGVGNPETVPSWRGIAADAGLMLRHEFISVGVIARDVASTRLVFGDGTTQTIAPTYSCGLGLKPLAGAILAVDAHGISPGGEHEILSGGFEGWLSPNIAVRGGVIMGDGANHGATAYTGGVGLRFGDFEMGYALLTSQEEIRKQCITLSRRF